MFIWDSY